MLAACSQPAPPAPPAAAPAAPAAGPSWSQFVGAYLEAWFKANPTQAVNAGRHEFDGVMPDWSPEGLTKEIARLHAARQQASAFSEAALSEADRFERDYLISRIDADLFWLEISNAAFENPAFYLGLSDWGNSLDPSVYVMRPYASLDVRARAMMKYLNSVVAVAPQIRKNLKTPMPATYVALGIAGFGGYADFFRHDVSKAFAEVTDPALKSQLAAALKPAAAAMQALADWLKGERHRATGPIPLGLERYAKMLSMTESVDLPLPAIEAAGRADLERNLAQLKDACAAFAKGASAADCLLKVGANKPKGGAIEGARAQLADLRQFVADNRVVSIPSEDQALVAEAPPFNRQNFAYIDIPGPFERGLPAVYYIAPPDPHWSKKDQAAYLPGQAILLFTSVHEVWPGHFLQFLHANRVQSKFGQVFVGYAFAEGWAHYSEELMWEQGLGGDPETHIGQLSEALLRNVRFLSSIGVHTAGLTVAQSEQMFRTQAFQDPGNARQQAARATYDPGYLNYTLGKLMIRKLRDDWTATRGGKAAWKDFHDKLLSFGGPPLPLVRRAMLGANSGALL
jgi:uncharacterized protein (DUF885 family)